MKVAIVGCGVMGSMHAASYMSIPGVTVAGVYDIDAGAMQGVAGQTGAAVYASYADMLEQSGCEVVSITAPSNAHKALAIEAAKAGKHVICEKPIALTLEDAAEMIEICAEHGVRLFVGHVVRYFPEFMRIKSKIGEGLIGRPGVAHARRASMNPGETRPWFKDDAQSGGVVLDLMIHDLDFLRWTLGEVHSVYGRRVVHGEVDYATATLRFESGAVANVEGYWGYPGSFYTAAEIAGSSGLVRHDSRKEAPLYIHKASGASSVESPLEESPYTAELRDFLDSIQTGREPKVSPNDAVKALEIALAIMESVRTGKTVYFNSNTQEVSQ